VALQGGSLLNSGIVSLSWTRNREISERRYRSFNRHRTEFNRSAHRVRSQETNEQSSTNVIRHLLFNHRNHGKALLRLPHSTSKLMIKQSSNLIKVHQTQSSTSRILGIFNDSSLDNKQTVFNESAAESIWSFDAWHVDAVIKEKQVRSIQHGLWTREHPFIPQWGRQYCNEEWMI